MNGEIDLNNNENVQQLVGATIDGVSLVREHGYNTKLRIRLSNGMIVYIEARSEYGYLDVTAVDINF